MPDFSTNNHCHFLPWCCIALISCAISLSGCGSSAESHEDEHHDEHHDEHLEHFVPAHKPNTFADLVDQLAKRAPQLEEANQPGDSLSGSDSLSDSDSGGGHATALQEFSDIVGWIPELAADSELMKADFESAVATGNKLTAAFAETLGPQSTKPFDAATIEPLIEELRKLVPQSQDRKDRM